MDPWCSLIERCKLKKKKWDVKVWNLARFSVGIGLDLFHLSDLSTSVTFSSPSTYYSGHSFISPSECLLSREEIGSWQDWAYWIGIFLCLYTVYILFLLSIYLGEEMVKGKTPYFTSYFLYFLCPDIIYRSLSLVYCVAID